MIEKLYTVEEIASLASVTGRTIRNYLKSGRLVGRKIGGQWRFTESEVQRLLSGEMPLPNPAAPSAAPQAPGFSGAAPQPAPPAFPAADAPAAAQLPQAASPVQPSIPPAAMPVQPSPAVPEAAAPSAYPQPAAVPPAQQPPAEGAERMPVAAAPQAAPQAAPLPPATEPDDETGLLLRSLSEVGLMAARFSAEVHDCAEGPQLCAVVDAQHSLDEAKANGATLSEFARQGSTEVVPCRAFVEYDGRYSLARYTLFGGSSFLAQALQLIR